VKVRTASFSDAVSEITHRSKERTSSSISETYTGSGKNTWRFGNTALSGTVGVGNLALFYRNSKHFSCHWALVWRALGFRCGDDFQKTTILSLWLSRYFVGTSKFIRMCVHSRNTSSSEDISRVRCAKRNHGGFETEHRRRSGSNFSQHTARSDAELPETLAGMC